MDKSYIQGITKCDMDDNYWYKNKYSSKIKGSYWEIRDRIVTP